jgi:hypothetical protein
MPTPASLFVDVKGKGYVYSGFLIATCTFFVDDFQKFVPV